MITMTIQNQLQISPDIIDRNFNDFVIPDQKEDISFRICLGRYYSSQEWEIRRKKVLSTTMH